MLFLSRYAKVQVFLGLICLSSGIALGMLPKKVRNDKKVNERDKRNARQAVIAYGSQLLFAALSGDIQKVRGLVAIKELDVNVTAVDGFTALMFATSRACRLLPLGLLPRRPVIS